MMMMMLSTGNLILVGVLMLLLDSNERYTDCIPSASTGSTV